MLHNIFHHENSPSSTDAYGAQDIQFLTQDTLRRCTISVGWDFMVRKLVFQLRAFDCVTVAACRLGGEAALADPGATMTVEILRFICGVVAFRSAASSMAQP